MSDAYIHPKSALDVKRREECEEKQYPQFAELRERLLSETEIDSIEEICKEIEELMDFLESIDFFEALKLQDLVCAKRFEMLEKQYDVNKMVEKAYSILETKGHVRYELLTPNEAVWLSARNSKKEIILDEFQISIMLMQYYRNLHKYLREAKFIGLGLPEKNSMRIARLIFTLGFYLEKYKNCTN